MIVEEKMRLTINNPVDTIVDQCLLLDFYKPPVNFVFHQRYKPLRPSRIAKYKNNRFRFSLVSA